MAKASISEHEAFEQELGDKNPQLQDYLATTGVIGDETIKDPNKRKKQQKKRKHLYHNTQLLMENYQTMVWVIENFPDTVAEELNEPLEETDRLLERIDLEFSMENQRLENRIRTIAKSRALIDRVNAALTMLRSKPGNGEEMYQVIYQTYNSGHHPVRHLHEYPDRICQDREDHQHRRKPRRLEVPYLF